MSKKVYVAHKPCKKPKVLVQFNENESFIDVTNNGLEYYEDEIGYYFISGELEPNIT